MTISLPLFWTLAILAGIGATALFLWTMVLLWLALVWKRANKQDAKCHFKLVRSKPFQEAANRQIDDVFQEYTV
jgi:hypothetical protein